MNVVELLSEMISYNTVNSAISGKAAPEAELSAFLEKTARGLGFETRRIDVPGQCSDLLISFEHDPESPWLLFDSHLDTVSVDGMIVEPFSAKIEDDRLYGRGSADTKGSGAAMLVALAEYASSIGGAESSGCNIMLLYSIDEEQGMSGIRSFVTRGLPTIDRKVVGAIVGEPTELKPVVAHNGVQRFRISARGVATHSADPSRGRSAISDIARLVVHLEETYIPSLDAEHPFTGKAQCSINVIRGGSAVNIIPETCEIEVDRRTVPGESADNIVEGLKSSLERFETERPAVELDLYTDIETPPLTPVPDHGFLEGVSAAVAESGHDGDPIGVRYATHAGDLCVAGIPSVVLGPGNIDQGHTKDEWISIAQLKAAVPLYKRIMQGVHAG